MGKDTRRTHAARGLPSAREDFDHERIPERVVHARGAAAHGIFEPHGAASSVTKAAFLAEEGTVAPVFS